MFIGFRLISCFVMGQRFCNDLMDSSITSQESNNGDMLHDVSCNEVYQYLV